MENLYSSDLYAVDSLTYALAQIEQNIEYAHGAQDSASLFELAKILESKGEELAALVNQIRETAKEQWVKEDNEKQTSGKLTRQAACVQSMQEITV